ncbi:hypothetical protein ACIGW0_00500 [Streptomyces bikiniensis]|uniref:Integral membrane protein n=1 Tax=Streptomyces bikiniensis TaxID=1896 RepID=A0ABW8CN52_STRBI
MTPSKKFQPTFKTRDGKTVAFSASVTNDVAAKKRAGLTKAGFVPAPRTAPAPALADEIRAVERPARRGIPAAPTALFVLNAVATGWAYATHELGVLAGTLASYLVLYLLVGAFVKPKRRRHRP